MASDGPTGLLRFQFLRIYNMPKNGSFSWGPRRRSCGRFKLTSTRGTEKPHPKLLVMHPKLLQKRLETYTFWQARCKCGAPSENSLLLTINMGFTVVRHPPHSTKSHDVGTATGIKVGALAQHRNMYRMAPTD